MPFVGEKFLLVKVNFQTQIFFTLYNKDFTELQGCYLILLLKIKKKLIKGPPLHDLESLI